MNERWFTEEELTELSRPTMDRAIEAIDAGDLDGARRRCEEMKHEWLMLHDLMVEGVLGLISFIQDSSGTTGCRGVGVADGERLEAPHDAINRLPRKELVYLLAPPGGHTRARVGEHPGAFTITEDDEKVTFTMNPCGSGQRLVRKGIYELLGAGRTREAHDWSYGRKDFPLYCTHCTFMNESLPISGAATRSTRPIRRRLRHRSVHLVLVQGPGRDPRSATGRATARSSPAGS